ncbi:MAG: hypothetical protein PWQ97_302 [Tepidanaerobacteraceae bacterium]|nr:hypothetical protein [Tepidanaerobacteraceae bacterium]
MIKKHLTAVCNIIIRTALIILIISALTLTFFLVQSRLTGREPSVFGYKMYIVMSGSMSPALKTRSLIIVDPIDPGDVAPGDIITFRGDDHGGNITTHRVIEVEKSQTLLFRTKGDANEVEDPMPVRSNRLIGKVVFSIPYVGYAFSYARTKNGIMILLGAFVIFILMELSRTLAIERKNKKISTDD